MNFSSIRPKVRNFCLFLLIFAFICDTASADFRPDYKEAACKLESKDSTESFRLGLSFFKSAKGLLKNLLSFGKPFKFDNLEIKFDKNSEVYAYWRPNKPNAYVYGYSNSCYVTTGTATPGAVVPAGEEFPVSYSEPKQACCMFWQRLKRKTVAGPQAVLSGKNSGYLENQAYVTGWYGRKDCSQGISTTDSPDFVQTMIPTSRGRNYSFNIKTQEKKGTIEAYYKPMDLLLNPDDTLDMSISHPGYLKATCTPLGHTFSKRPPPRPHPPFDVIPPYPKKDRFLPFIDKKDFKYAEELYKTGSG